MLPLFTNSEYVAQPHSKRYIKLNNCEFTISSSPDIYAILASGLSLTTLLSNNFDTIKKMIIDQGETDIDYIEDILFVGDPSSIVLIGNTISFQGDSPPLLVKYTTINPNLFKLKRGTRYLKWTRTIDEDGSLFTDIGTDLIIDANTFSGEYMVVGETYVREQKTGRDQRC
ncbi:MAG: hypothetical protein LUC37_00970 [Prevotella sp.]|nr:hypothetical protein [Prevotella sp.]